MPSNLSGVRRQASTGTLELSLVVLAACVVCSWTLRHKKPREACAKTETSIVLIAATARRYFRKLRSWPTVGWVRFGSFRRVTPISTVFGFDRGQPIDRYYIEQFLQKHSFDIRECVLEIGDSHYTTRFGGDRVSRSEVLHAAPGNPEATLVGDLATGRNIPNGAFDCMILTQTLPFIYDVKAVIQHARAALKPGGILLATVPCISQISRYDMERWGDYWRFTDASARRLFGDIFGPENITIATHGNVLAACAFLHGLSAHELKQQELDHHDPDYQVLIAVRALKKAF